MCVFPSRDKDGGHGRMRKKSHAARKCHGSVFYRTEVIADSSFTLRQLGILRFFAVVTLTLTR